jgi:hypothetical protein
MPSTLQAALVLVLLIAPGYVLLQGYRRARSYSVPDRDLYVLAQAVVAGLGWIASVWLVLSLVGLPLSQWGLLPEKNRLLEAHQAAIALLVLGIEFLPFALGLLAGFTINWLQSAQRARLVLGWTGIFESPTAWEQAWNEAAARAGAVGGSRTIEVGVRLKCGEFVRGRYGSSSRADLSPRPSHQLFLETAYGLDDKQTPARLVGDGTIGGVFIDASEISTIYFNS